MFLFGRACISATNTGCSEISSSAPDMDWQPGSADTVAGKGMWTRSSRPRVAPAMASGRRRRVTAKASDIAYKFLQNGPGFGAEGFHITQGKMLKATCGPAWQRQKSGPNVAQDASLFLFDLGQGGNLPRALADSTFSALARVRRIFLVFNSEFAAKADDPPSAEGIGDRPRLRASDQNCLPPDVGFCHRVLSHESGTGSGQANLHAR